MRVEAAGSETPPPGSGRAPTLPWRRITSRRLRVAWRGGAGACAFLVVAGGYHSADQPTYERETQRLEQQQREQEPCAAAEHAEASRHAAVVYFDVGSAVVGPDGQRELRWLVGEMQPYPQAVLLAHGFADITGSAPQNEALSTARARAVGDVLTAQGIGASQRVIQGFGTQAPAAPNETVEGRRRNRRVAVTVR